MILQNRLLNSISFLGTCVFVWIPSLPQYFKVMFVTQCIYTSVCNGLEFSFLLILRELWEGKRPGTRDAILFFGFDEVT